MITLRRFLPVLAVLALSLTAGACSGEQETPTESLPMATEELDVAVWEIEEIQAEPAFPEEGDARLVVVAANLACARQSSSFASLDDIATLEQHLLEAHGVTTEEFASFEADQAEDAELRSAVRDVFVENCSPA